MTWSAVVIPLLVPPVNLVWLAGLGWLCRWRALTGVSLGLLMLSSLPVVSIPLLGSLEAGLPRSNHGEAGAIVVLGGELTEGSGGVLPGPLTLGRLRAGAALARRTGLPVLVTGGTVQTGSPPVASVMAASLHADFGVAARWVEPRSVDTWQNAQASAAMLRGSGVRSVLLVTDAWHMRRALIAFGAAGLRAMPAPALWDPASDLRRGAFVPHATSWIRSYYAFHEWIGCAWYAIRAWHHSDAGPQAF